LKYAKRIGVRQSSGAVPGQHVRKISVEHLCANDNLNCHSLLDAVQAQQHAVPASFGKDNIKGKRPFSYFDS